MILQTGQRTDIPAFYSKWFLQRLEAGFVRVRNPYHPFQVTQYSTKPEHVDFIGFTSKNPGPLLRHWQDFKHYDQLWHITLTPYGKDLEPHVPPNEAVVESIQALSQHLGPKKVVWRYDPLIITDVYTVRKHIDSFAHLGEALAPYVDTVITSFIDLYPSVVRLHPELSRPAIEVQELVLKELLAITQDLGIRLKTCGEGKRFGHLGLDTSDCYSKEEFERIFNKDFQLPHKAPARSTCACYLHGDIGQYNTCQHFCSYCYANTEVDTVRHNWQLHDPQSPFIIGHDRPEDVITLAPTQLYAKARKPQEDSLF